MFLTLFVWLFIITTAKTDPGSVEETCPRSLVNEVDPFYLQVRNGVCFHFVLYKHEIYSDASKDCSTQHGGTLALPKTPDLNTYLVDQLLHHYHDTDEVWIGLHDTKEETHFIWDDGSELEWNNFAIGKGPNNNWLEKDAADCAALDPKNGGLWSDFLCEGDFLSWLANTNHNKSYICQYASFDDGHLTDDGKNDEHTVDQTEVAPGATVDEACPPGLLNKTDPYYLKVRDGSCFHFVLYNRKTYGDASKDCSKDGGTLALPKTQSLNTYLTYQMLNFYDKEDEFWIGLDDLEEETKFVWQDGSEMVWSNFAKGNGPDNAWLARGVEDCVALNPENGGKWDDYQCDDNLLSWISKPNPNKMYICQYTIRS